MASYPTCIRCLGTESELDLDGLCTTCLSRGSGRDSAGQKVPKSTVPPQSRTVEDDGTRTAPPGTVDPGTETFEQRRITPVSEFLPPVRFTNYTNLEYLDRGGMGVVYKALQVNANRIVALKTINAFAHSDSRQERRFKTEGQALARLSHPGIVQIYDVNEEQGLPYFSMEYVPGGTLAKRMKTGPRPTHRESAELAVGIASAIAAAHAQKIVHRDIKPSNILLTDIGKPKVTDFGLASFFDQSVHMTATGAMIGTPAYMSPEQAAGKFSEVGPLSDVYSIGATLYELLTGKPPFSAETPVATALKVCHERIVRPRTHDATIPADLEAITLKCLEKDPRDRYASASALANDLTRFLRGEPVTPQTKTQKLKRFVRRNKVALILTGFLLIASGIAFAMIPEDPKKTIERKLRRGESVELVKASGLPLYSRREVGAGDLALRDHPNGDRAPYFGTAADSITLYELCHDTMTNKYTVEAELQHASTEHMLGRVGLYFRSPGGDDLFRWVSVEYSDFFVAAERVPLPNQKSGLRMVDRITFTKPTTFHVHPEEGYRFVFDPVGRGDAPWRPIRVDVSPEGITAYWPVKEEMKPVLIVPKKEFIKADLALRTAVIEKTPEFANKAAPPWSARGAIGVFAERGTLAFKNVTITPTP